MTAVRSGGATAAPAGYWVAMAPRRNRLLSWLPPPASADLEARCRRRQFEFDDGVYEQDGSIDDVVFPLTAVFSLISTTSEGRGAEVATIGNEGVVGLPAFLEPRLPTAHRAIAQVPGEALTMPASEFLDVAADNRALHVALHGYAQALMTQIAQGSVCNRLHPVLQRCVRWLLQTHDRVGRDQFVLTQRFLGQMLGAGRDTVNQAAGELQRAGIIRYVRGNMTILDRPGLERAGCECYFVVQRQFERLLALPLDG
jgi:CRP-like cAMP-binding protein